MEEVDYMPIQYMTSDRILDEINRLQIPVIIFGVGIVGKTLLKFCQKNNIEIDSFCDNSHAKSKEVIDGKSVVFTQNINNKYKEAIILITAADIRDVVVQLDSLGDFRLYSGAELLKSVDLEKLELEDKLDFVKYAVETCVLCHESYLCTNKLFLRSVDVVITEKCSMRCQDCANLMQYYTHPVDCDLSKTIESIDNLWKVVDEVNEFRVIGGEPFMNKNWFKVVDRLINDDKVKKVIIYTNGTIVPKEEHAKFLANDKLIVFITDYGYLSKNISNFEAYLLEHNISYYIRKASGWTRCGIIKKHNRNIDELEYVFMNCCAKNLITLIDGLLYRCPFIANANRLGALPDDSSNYFDLSLLNDDIESIEKYKNELRAYLYDISYLNACNYCKGRFLSDPEIEPAIQSDFPIEYEKSK